MCLQILQLALLARGRNQAPLYKYHPKQACSTSHPARGSCLLYVRHRVGVGGFVYFDFSFFYFISVFCEHWLFQLCLFYRHSQEPMGQKPRSLFRTWATQASQDKTICRAPGVDLWGNFSRTQFPTMSWTVLEWGWLWTKERTFAGTGTPGGCWLRRTPLSPPASGPVSLSAEDPQEAPLAASFTVPLTGSQTRVSS